MDYTIYVNVLDFYFRSIAVYITVYILEFILPTNGPSISGGLFCAPEYCSVFAVIQLYTADTESLFKLAHFYVISI